MERLPTDAEPLEISGYFAHAQPVTYDRGWNRNYTVKQNAVTVQFMLLKQGDYRPISYHAVDVELPDTDDVSHFTSERDLTCQIQVNRLPHQLDAKGASMLAKVVDLAAAFAASVDEANEPVLEKIRDRIAQREREREEQRARWEKERQERIEQMRKQREEREQRYVAAKEQLQWYVGQKFKLRRAGYRSTVMGTVMDITDHHMRTISEKDIPMRIDLADITQFSVKYEGEKRYTLVYTREEVTHAG